MADPRFFGVDGPFSLKELAEISLADIDASANPDRVFTDVASLDMAGPDDISFLDNRNYLDNFSKSRAGACIVRPELASMAPEGMNLLLTNEPYRGYARIAQAFYPQSPPGPGISENASVDKTAILADDCKIDAGAAIGPRAEIGRRCHIGSNAVIGDGVVIGDDCRIGPCVSIAYCNIGKRVIIHDGVRVGADGFGFALGPEGHLKVPQLGRVIIHDDVEIGANTTIDRGSGPDTVIGAGCKIDNLVQIAHNVRIGRNCVIVSHVGISGSTTIGDFVVIGGQVGVAGHLNIGNGVRVAAQSGIMRDVEAGSNIGGSPAVPVREWLKGIALLERMVKKKGR